MRYEAHITVDLRRACDVGGFIDTCKTLGGKALFIELIPSVDRDFGQMKQPFQAMLGRSLELLDDTEALDWADNLRARMETHFHVLRTKVEAEISAGHAEYYEAHWKFNEKNPLPHWKDHTFMSRSALDRNKFWLTSRFYGAGWNGAFNHFESTSNKFKYDRSALHYERVIYDSNQALDEGWTYKTPDANEGDFEVTSEGIRV